MTDRKKLECPVCGAVSWDRSDLCAARPAPNPCATREVPAARLAERTPSVEMIFCEAVAERARHACSHCGRLATAPDLVCLPRDRRGS